MLSGSRMVPIQFQLTEAILNEIELIGRDRAPSEACGLILPPPGERRNRPGRHPQVIELPNRSLTPRDSYEILGTDTAIELDRWLDDPDVTQEDVDSMVVWHTHPSGGIGPSKTDIRQRPDAVAMIVVSLLPSRGHICTTF